MIADSTTAPTANEEQGVHWQRGGVEQETTVAELIQEAQGNLNSVGFFPNFQISHQCHTIAQLHYEEWFFLS